MTVAVVNAPAVSVEEEEVEEVEEVEGEEPEEEVTESDSQAQE